MDDLPSITFRMATEDDGHLAAYDHTKISALNLCPTWGIIRYGHHRVFASSHRAMALEAGTAMHEVFAYVRLASLTEQLVAAGRDAAFVERVRSVQGSRLFGGDRWATIRNASPAEEDVSYRLKHDCITVLETSGFYDDDRDKRRTLTNLEECALHYVNKWDFKPPIWMRDDTDPDSDVGIEIPFDIVCEPSDRAPFRFTGKLDGLRWHGQGRTRRLVVEDNKTASRLNEAWELSFETSHQLTGYCLASSVFTHEQVRNAEAIGLTIPLPRSEFTGYIRAPVERTDEQLSRFLSWMLQGVADYERYQDDPLNAPMYTHSCNRYFRPCSLIPVCSSSIQERIEAYDEMVVDEWSPLHEHKTTEE